MEQLQIENSKKTYQWHQIVTDGGMGDLIGELVAVDFNIRNHTHVQFQVWVPDYLYDFACHVLPKESTIRPFSKAKAKFKHNIKGVTTEWCTNHTCMRTHPVDYGFHMLSDRHIYDLNKKNYLQINPDKIDIKRHKLPDKYVVIVAAATEPVKEMPAQTANEISDYVIQKGFVPVYIGKEKSEAGFKDFAIKAKTIQLDYSKGINLLNKTNMLEAAKIIHGSKVMIGIDGGLIHLAGCTDAEIVAGYTLVDPIHVAPIRKGSQSYKFHAIEPDLGIKNRYYQTNRMFTENEDMRVFPGWQDVIANMTSDKFIEVLDKIL